jgi:cytochrome b
MDQALDRRIKIWDPVVRIGHWTIVAGFAAAYVTEEDLLSVHVWAGYVVGAAVALRILWGFIGPPHARFSDFIYSPRVVLSSLLDLVHFRGARYLGHSPAGGAMVIALLILLAGTVATGLMTYAADKHAGPLAPLYAASLQQVATGPVAAGGEKGESPLREIHELLANLTLILVVLHIAGVALASVVHRENLVAAMITGQKRAELPRSESSADLLLRR